MSDVEQRGFAGIGVADQSQRRHWNGLAPLTLLGADAADIFQLLFDMAYAAVNFPPVGFELSFAGSAGANTAAQLRHLDAAPSQARQHIVKLRQLHLQLAFTGASVFGKNVEDELSAIDHANVDHPLDVALLRGGEIVVEEQKIGGNRSGGARDLFQFAAADQSGRVRAVAALQEFSGNFGAGAPGQGAEFVKRFFRAELRNAGGFGDFRSAG